jgi:hypothetical protein
LGRVGAIQPPVPAMHLFDSQSIAARKKGDEYFMTISLRRISVRIILESYPSRVLIAVLLTIFRYGVEQIFLSGKNFSRA